MSASRDDVLCGRANALLTEAATILGHQMSRSDVAGWTEILRFAIRWLRTDTTRARDIIEREMLAILGEDDRPGRTQMNAQPDLVEQAARAMYATNPQMWWRRPKLEPLAWDDTRLPDGHRARVRDLARAALEAATEPTPEMIIVGLTALVAEIVRLNGPMPELTAAQLSGEERIPSSVSALRDMMVGATLRSGQEIAATFRAMMNAGLAR